MSTAMATGVLSQFTGQDEAVSSDKMLINLLENEALRNSLIAKLKSNTSEQALVQESHAFSSFLTGFGEKIKEVVSIVEQKTQAYSTDSSALISSALGGFQRLVLQGAFSHVIAQLGLFLMVIFFAISVRWGLSYLAKDTLVYISQQRSRGEWYFSVALMCRAIVEMSNIALAWFAAYLVIYFVSSSAWLDILMRHFLVAYVLFSVGLVTSKIVLAPFYEPLRVVNLSNESAIACYRWFRVLLAYIAFICLFVQGVMTEFMVPDFIIASYAQQCVLVFSVSLIGLVWYYKKPISKWIQPDTAEDDLQKLSGIYTLRMTLSQVWHWVATVYFIAMSWAWMFDFDQTFSQQIQSSVLTIALIGAFIFVRWSINFVEAYLRSMVSHYQKDLPFFAKRACSMITFSKKLVQIIVAASTWFFFLAIWRLIDLDTLLMSSFWLNVIDPMSHVVFVVFCALLIWLACVTMIEYKLMDSQKSHPRFAKDNDTILHLLRNIITIAILLITSIIVLADLGVHVGPLIAGAGVISLAVGFGAQTLVKDVINGLFNIIEGTLKVGSWVKINGQEGWVERVTLRTVSLRNNQTGTLSIVPFSEVSIVENFTKGYAFYYTSIEVGYDENYDEVAKVLDHVGEVLMQDESVKGEILAPLEVRGLSAFEANGFKVSCRIKTMAGRQRVVGRVFNRLVKEHFDAKGISFPYPTRTIHLVKDD